MIERLYRLDLHLQGPLLSQAAGTLAFGLDAAMQRYREEPVLNGPQIRGNLRHVLLRFKRTTDAFRPYFSDWFPNEPELGTTWRSTLDFDLFWRPNCVPDKDGTRTRIKIDSATGKVEKGALQVLEDPFPSGSSVTFSGNIHARFADEKERACSEKWIDKALQWLDAIGSQKGVGYGRLMGHKLATINVVPSDNPELPGDTQRFGVRLQIDRPFCIGRQKSRLDNRIVSSSTIPGEVIKGVLARQLAQRQDLKDDQLSTALQQQLAFDQLVINHAKPMAEQAGDRPGAIPLNLANIGERWHRYTTEDPKQIEWKQAPEFQPDWKPGQWQEAAKHLGLDDRQPERLLLVRTAIEEGQNISKQSALFSLECIEPQGFEWAADIDLSKVAESARPRVIKNLQTMLNQGLDGIGKTRARARVKIADKPFSDTNPPPATATGLWQVTLQTPARLLPFKLTLSGINDAATLHKLYQDYWDKVSGRTLKLLTYFAQQEMAGGDDFNHRFRKPKPYAPEWLTRSGSVFILQAEPPDRETACRKLREWLRSNLPAWEDESEKADWRTTVHIPQHGYGEITVEAL